MESPTLEAITSKRRQFRRRIENAARGVPQVDESEINANPRRGRRGTIRTGLVCKVEPPPMEWWNTKRAEQQIAWRLHNTIAYTGVIEAVKKTVAEKFEVTVGDLEATSQRPRYVIPRMACYWLCREISKMSLPEIGRRMGGRDHSTILTGIRKFLDVHVHNEDVADRIVKVIVDLPITDKQACQLLERVP